MFFWDKSPLSQKDKTDRICPFEEKINLAMAITAGNFTDLKQVLEYLGRMLDKKIELKQEIHFPDSLGLFYSAFTYYLGFKVNSAEYKVMGLAPYGQPKYYDFLRSKVLCPKDDSPFPFP